MIYLKKQIEKERGTHTNIDNAQILNLVLQLYNSKLLLIVITLELGLEIWAEIQNMAESLCDRILTE